MSRPTGSIARRCVALAAFPALFGCRPAFVAVALVAAPLWSVGIVQATGTTGSNVASSCGKLMIIVFAAWYPPRRRSLAFRRPPFSAVAASAE